MSSRHDPQHSAARAIPAGELPFRTLLYRFIFFDWLFKDMSATQDLYERHAVWQHNRRMSRYLPTYLRRWSFLTVVDFLLGFAFERLLQASLVSAWFFTWSCVTLAGMAVIAVSWLMLTYAKM